MIKRLVAAIMLAAFCLSAVAGCYEMGKATGQGAKETEKGADAFKEGYKKENP